MLKTKEDLLKNLRKILDECGEDKQYCWIDIADLLDAIKLNLVTVTEKNVDQKDDTFKTVVEFEKMLFVYVGEKI